MGLSTTPILRMRADWTASGTCISGSTALPRGATRRVSGGAVTTSTTSDEPDHERTEHKRTRDGGAHGLRASVFRGLGAALRRQRGGDDRLVCVHVVDG